MKEITNHAALVAERWHGKALVAERWHGKVPHPKIMVFAVHDDLVPSERPGGSNCGIYDSLDEYIDAHNEFHKTDVSKEDVDRFLILL
jgi:hypothetical protein